MDTYSFVVRINSINILKVYKTLNTCLTLAVWMKIMNCLVKKETKQ